MTGEVTLRGRVLPIRRSAQKNHGGVSRGYQDVMHSKDNEETI